MVVAEAIQFNGWVAFTLLVFVLGFLGAALAVSTLVGVSVGIALGRALDARDHIPENPDERRHGSRSILVAGGLAATVFGWVVGGMLAAVVESGGELLLFGIGLLGLSFPALWGLVYGAPRSFPGRVGRPRPPHPAAQDDPPPPLSPPGDHP